MELTSYNDVMQLILITSRIKKMFLGEQLTWKDHSSQHAPAFLLPIVTLTFNMISSIH